MGGKSLLKVCLQAFPRLSVHFFVKGTMSAGFSNILKSQKSQLRQLKPENNVPVLLKVATLVH